MPEAPIGPGLGPSPAADGVPAFDETYQWDAKDGLHVAAGIIYKREPERARRLGQLQADRSSSPSVGHPAGT